MRPTLAFITERFNYFNGLIFKPQLPPLPLRIGSGRRALGSFKYPRFHPQSAPRGRGECSITISRAYDRPQNEIEDVLIHEMIHYFIWLNYVDEPSHGPEFRRVMDLINKSLNRNITVTESLSVEIKQTDTKPRIHYIVSTIMPDGRKTFACISKNSAAAIRRVLESNRLTLEWWVTQDPFFNRFPTVRTPKLFNITVDDYKAHILTAHRVPVGKERKP